MLSGESPGRADSCPIRDASSGLGWGLLSAERKGRATLRGEEEILGPRWPAAGSGAHTVVVVCGPEGSLSRVCVFLPSLRSGTQRPEKGLSHPALSAAWSRVVEPLNGAHLSYSSSPLPSQGHVEVHLSVPQGPNSSWQQIMKRRASELAVGLVRKDTENVERRFYQAARLAGLPMLPLSTASSFSSRWGFLVPGDTPLHPHTHTPTPHLIRVQWYGLQGYIKE